MLRIKIELLPWGRESLSRTLKTIELENTRNLDENHSLYTASVSEPSPDYEYIVTNTSYGIKLERVEVMEFVFNFLAEWLGYKVEKINGIEERPEDSMVPNKEKDSK